LYSAGVSSAELAARAPPLFDTTPDISSGCATSWERSSSAVSCHTRDRWWSSWTIASPPCRRACCGAGN